MVSGTEVKDLSELVALCKEIVDAIEAVHDGEEEVVVEVFCTEEDILLEEEDTAEVCNKIEVNEELNDEDDEIMVE